MDLGRYLQKLTIEPRNLGNDLEGEKKRISGPWTAFPKGEFVFLVNALGQL